MMESRSFTLDSSAVTFEYNQRGHQVFLVVEIYATSGKTRAVITEEPKTFFYYNRSAATLHGLPVPWSADPMIAVAVLGPHGLPRSRGVRGRRADATTTTVVVRGLRVVSPVDNWITWLTYRTPMSLRRS